MKLALIFLLAFVVAVSQSQLRQHKKLPWSAVPYYYSPRSYYSWPDPSAFDNIGYPSDSPSAALDSEAPYFHEPEEDRINSKDWQWDPSQIQSRVANSRFRPQQRLFFGALNPFGGAFANSNNNNNNNNNFPPFLRVTSTTVTVTVPTTLLTAVVTTCIPAAQFVATGASVTCARRRRDIAQIMDQTDDGQPQVSPTVVQKVEQTVSPITGIERERRELNFQQQAIASSKNDEMYINERRVGDDDDVHNRRPVRAYVITYTTTSTSFIFSSTIIKKPLSLVPSAALVCLPSGFTVC